MLVVALDPGGSTGWAMYEALVLEPPDFSVPARPPEYYNEKWSAGHIQPEGQPHHEQLYAFLETWHTHEYTLVCESYEKAPGILRTANDPTPEYIGVVKRFAEERNVEVVWQGAQMQAFWTPSRLRQLGLWIPGQRHAMSARKHLLHYLVNSPKGPQRKDILRRLK